MKTLEFFIMGLLSGLLTIFCGIGLFLLGMSLDAPRTTRDAFSIFIGFFVGVIADIIMVIKLCMLGYRFFIN